MAKEDLIKIKGKVLEILPNATFKVQAYDKNEPLEQVILCHISGRMRQNKINILQNDFVDIELSVYDLSKGRIVYRYK